VFERPNMLSVMLALVVALLGLWPSTANAHMGVGHDVSSAAHAYHLAARFPVRGSASMSKANADDLRALIGRALTVIKGGTNLPFGQVVATASPADTSSCLGCCTDNNCAGCVGCCVSTGCVTTCTVGHSGLETAVICMSPLQILAAGVAQLDHELVGLTNPPEPKPPRL